MALTYGFYNSIEGDRVYDAIQFGRIFDGIIKDGVYATYEKGMMVIASSNPAEVIIQPGRAWFNHTWSYNDANVIFEAPAPEVLLERYDALVLEVNEELSSRENSYKWVTGTPSSRPERPTLTNTSTIHQYPLCYVHRYPETTMIYTRDITNMVGTSECPFATGVLEGIDLDAWINQWDDEFHTWENTTKTGFETWMLNQEQVYTAWFDSMHSQMDTDLAEFEAWFKTIQGIIDEDAALHLQQEIDELRQEATSGSRIFVHTQEQTLIGKNVTITEAGGTVFTSKFDNTGVAEFKSIPYVGNLTISSTDGVQTATSVVNTPYYARYNFTIAFWAATVNIVGDPEMSGSTVTVRDSNEVLVGTVILDSEGTGIFTATAPDTYKFILTYGGETMEVTLSVTQETTYTVDLHANRFKWENWLEAGGVTGSYSSLDDVLADEVALRRLFTVHASVDYMASINKENEDVETIINNDLAAKWINLRDYALDTLYANTIIKGYMDTADKYGYGEWALMPQAPTMTSNTAPYGEAFAKSSWDSGWYPWKAFDGNTSNDDAWATAINDIETQYIGYKSENPICVKKVSVRFANTPPRTYWRSYTLQGSNDDNTWNDIGTTTISESVASLEFEVNNSVSYLYHRLYLSDVYQYTGSDNNIRIVNLQFYAWQPKGNVPVMTSNTAPYGEASASNIYGSGYEAYKAFDGNDNTQWATTTSGASNAYLRYKFTNPTCVKKISFIPQYNAGLRVKTFSVKASNDGTNWTTLKEITTLENTPGIRKYDFDISNDDYYLYYELADLTSYSEGVEIRTLQFYGRELSVSVPAMTGNTTPYGEAIESSEWSGSYSAYKAFASTSVSGNGWGASSSDSFGSAYVGYDFLKGMRLRKVLAGFEKGTSNLTSVQFRIEGTNDKNGTWTPIDTITMNTFNAWLSFDMDSDVSYRYIRGVYLANSASGLTNGNGIHFQFYGFDYSEKEFEEGTTKKWLYDHGVELDGIVFEPTAFFQSGGTTSSEGYPVAPLISKEGNSVIVTENRSGNNIAVGQLFIDKSFDLSNYSLAMLKVGTARIYESGFAYQSIGIVVTPSKSQGYQIVAQNGIVGQAGTSGADVSTGHVIGSLDISSINQVVYLLIYMRSTGKIEFSEFWLE